MADNVLLFKRPHAAPMSSTADATVLAGRNPATAARLLCRQLEVLPGEEPRILIHSIARRMGLPPEVVVGAAVYAHLKGWIVFACDSPSLERPSPGRSRRRLVNRASAIPAAEQDEHRV